MPLKQAAERAAVRPALLPYCGAWGGVGEVGVSWPRMACSTALADLVRCTLPLLPPLWVCRAVSSTMPRNAAEIEEVKVGSFGGLPSA